jgi:hypothetical protein
MIYPARALLKFVLLGFISILRSILAEETWLEYSSIIASDASEGGSDFGRAVAIFGTTIVVGDPLYGGTSGQAYVFSLNVNIFEQDAVLDPEEATNQFGRAVDIDDATIVVGDDGLNAAFVFVKDGGGVWSLQAKLVPSVAGGSFGFAVAVNGNRILVGAYEANGDVGAAYVFERIGTNWSETQILTPSDNAVGGLFGTDVDLEGDAIVVGAYGRNSEKGAVYILALNDANVWEETGDIIEASDGTSGDRFGESVALSGSRIAVGAPSANNNGQAYVFTRSFGPDLQETAMLQGDAAGSDFFGNSVAIFGDTAVVGARAHDTSNGAAYVFKRDPVHHSWSQATKLTSSEGAGEVLGSNVAISGDFVVAGAFESDLAAPDVGAVYVFVEDPETQPPSVEPSQSPSVVPTSAPDKICAEFYRNGCSGSRYMMFRFVGPKDQFGVFLGCRTRCVSRRWVRFQQRFGYQCGSCLDVL